MRNGLGATYRVQLRPGFGFVEVARIAGYLAALGIELLAISPVTAARPGGGDGYDVADPTVLSAELGGAGGFGSLVTALERHGIGLLVDIVPSCMSTWVDGPWWGDVLRRGRSSPFAGVFEVDWDAGVPGDRGKVALPLLDRPLEELLSDGELAVVPAPGGTRLRVGDVALPLSGLASPGDDAAAVLAAQHYRLVPWRDGNGPNYRSFRDDDLVAVRQEDEDVFARTHVLVADLARSGVLSAVRVDHVDRLADPAHYLRQLHDLLGGIPILVDKVLSADEQLPESWPVAGTSGYESVDDVSCALVDAAGFGRLVRAAAREGERSVDEEVRAAKAEVLNEHFRAELHRAAVDLDVDAGSLREVALALPTYRTYRDDAASDALLARAAGEHAAGAIRRGGSRRGRFEQLTAVVSEAAIEGRAWCRLAGPIAFCEVGGDPRALWAGSPERLAVRSATRARDGRTGLVPGTTHATRHSADVRARLLALAELPDELEAGLVRFTHLVPAATLPDGSVAPAPLDRRQLAQILLAMAPPTSEGWVELPDRVDAALRRASRDAARHTSWTSPEPQYEAALSAAVHAALADEAAALRLAFGDIVDEVARLGAVVSLAAVTLRSVMPGSPDCYQGDETWNLLLAEPDNRRPVDFDALGRALGSLTAARTGDEPASLRRSWRDGRVKMLVTRQALRARRAAPSAFGPGATAVGVPVSGASATNAVALARVAPDGSRVAIAVVTRHARTLTAARDDLPVGPTAWSDTVLTLPAGAPAVYVDALTGRRHGTRGGGAGRSPTRDLWLADVLRDLPVAILVGAT